MTHGHDLLGGPPDTLLTDDPGPREALAGGATAKEVAALFPASPLPWALLADAAWADGEVVTSYAFARTGYHRGLDALRRHGWKGFGPVPWSHEPNQGWLRALFALGRAADAINETAEADRCSQFLIDSSPEAATALAG